MEKKSFGHELFFCSCFLVSVQARSPCNDAVDFGHTRSLPHFQIKTDIRSPPQDSKPASVSQPGHPAATF